MAIELDYAPELHPTIIAHLEAAARSIGLPLRDLELLGQDARTAKTFVARCLDGDADAFLVNVSWDQLEERLAMRSAALAPPGAPKVLVAQRRTRAF